MNGNEMLVPYIIAERQREARQAALARTAREARRSAQPNINRNNPEEFVVMTGAGVPVMISLANTACA